MYPSSRPINEVEHATNRAPYRFTAEEAKRLSSRNSEYYFKNAYGHIKARAKVGIDHAVLKHHEDANVERELVNMLREDGFKVYCDNLFVHWRCAD